MARKSQGLYENLVDKKRNKKQKKEFDNRSDDYNLGCIDLNGRSYLSNTSQEPGQIHVLLRQKWAHAVDPVLVSLACFGLQLPAIEDMMRKSVSPSP